MGETKQVNVKTATLSVCQARWCGAHLYALHAEAGALVARWDRTTPPTNIILQIKYSNYKGYNVRYPTEQCGAILILILIYLLLAMTNICHLYLMTS